jgi:hypothetical protein
MAGPVPMVVQSDVWIGTPEAEGSLFVKAGTVVSVTPGSELETQYGGPSNLGPLPPGETGDDADHAALGN